MYLTSNIPYFKCWVRKEFTHAHNDYHGEYIHGLAVAVTTIPDRCLSFQIIFTGCEAEGEPNPHGGAMWARMPITALVGDIPLDDWPERMQTHLAQPWDCSSYNHGLLRSLGHSLRLGCARLITSFILEDICLRWTTPRVMSPKTPPSINRAMFWY
jgi:hypothetical protein